VQQGLHKTLQGKSGKPAGTSDVDWEEMNLKGGKHDPTMFRRRRNVQCDG